ncbi:MAG: hypothetical protein KDC35_04385 [Acidobacteria bacterium]|nr:hypothetical protein [Acidobacteriota bacterium]
MKILCIASILLSSLCLAGNGDLDVTFDTDGKVTTDFAGNTDNASAVAIQADGKIVVAGYDSNAQEPVLARYNTNGSLDTSFDTDGKVITPITGNQQIQAMAIQVDGKIVVAGLSNTSGSFDFLAIRYNTNGSLDTSFDTDGIVTTDMGSSGSDQAFAIAIQADGKIVLGGFANGGDFCVVRYNSNGSLDTSFDTDGIAITDFGGNDQIKGIAIQTDGKIVATGFSNGAANDIALARYNTNGSLDTSFDTDGRVTTDVSGGSDQGRSIALQNDGKIVIAGIAPGSDIMLARYNTNGSLDTSFDTDGIVTTDINSGSNDQANELIIQTDNKAIVVGLTNANGAQFDFFAARYTTGGALDTSFNGDGLAFVDFNASSNDQGFSVAKQDDGYLVVVGLTNAPGTFDFGLARLENDDPVPVELMQFSVD